MFSRADSPMVSMVSGSAHLGKHKRTKEEIRDVERGTALPQHYSLLRFAEDCFECFNGKSTTWGNLYGKLMCWMVPYGSLCKSKLLVHYRRATWKALTSRKTGCQACEPAPGKKIRSSPEVVTRRQVGILQQLLKLGKHKLHYKLWLHIRSRLETFTLVHGCLFLVGSCQLFPHTTYMSTVCVYINICT